MIYYAMYVLSTIYHILYTTLRMLNKMYNYAYYMSCVYYIYTSAGQKFMLILAVWESCGYCRDEATAAQAMRQVYVKSHGVISRFCGVVCFPTWSRFPDSAE